MAANLDPGLRFDLWGPAVVFKEGYYILMGDKLKLPKWVTEPGVVQFIVHLSEQEALMRMLALPDERRALFHKKLRIITKDLPQDWRIATITAICVLFLCVEAVSQVKSWRSKL